MITRMHRPLRTVSRSLLGAACTATVVSVALLANAPGARAARQVTLTPVADSGLYGDSGEGRANRGAGGRFDIGPLQNVLLKFDLSGVLGAQEVIQGAILQVKEAKGDRYSFGMHVYAYPMAAPWQEGVGTTGGVVGSIGFPWGPASIGDAVYLYAQVTEAGLADQYPSLVSAGWSGYTVATNGVAWNQPGGHGVGTDVLNRLMIDQDWNKALTQLPVGTPLDPLNLSIEGVAVLNDWAKGTVPNNGMNVWASAAPGSSSARCGAREHASAKPELVLTIVGITSVTDLAASNVLWDRVTLTWTAPPATPGTGDVPASYDVRYSTTPITEASWAAATPIAGAPTPVAPGMPETFLVTGLTESTQYYFAVKSTDTGGQISGLSNVASAATPVHDVTAPAAVTDLATANVLASQLDLQWSSTGDDGMAGLANHYEIRYSTVPLNDANFAGATLVAQSLGPETPGYMESLAVTGLSPSTTYYFALKSYDEAGNVSALSNVASATTASTDSTAPAAITDLAGAAGDPLSIGLTWTAPGGDGSTGTAASYDIRYSTTSITEANWAATTRVPYLVPPSVAATAEHFTVFGLQPGTQYYFAVKTADLQGNISGLSNVASATTGTLPAMPLVTSLQIVEKGGVTTTNYPVTLSMVFAKGDVAGNVTVRVAGQVLATQTDVKVTWPDGSVRHALVSFIIPQVPANQSLAVDVLAGGPNYAGGWLTKDQLLASDFEARLRMGVGGTSTNVSARQLLQGIASPEYWVKGAVASELIIRSWAANVAGQLNVSYRVRVYPSAGEIRISTVVENTWINARGNITYDAALDLGRTTPVTVYRKTGLTHWHDARWHKVFWQGTTPPEIEVRYNLPYIIKTGAVPNYDTSLVVSASALTAEYNSWNNSAHDIMDGGGLTKYMPTTGGRSEIGPYPTWTSLYLCSMDYRLAKATINYGDLSGSIPMHFRESDPARSFYCRPIKIDDRPTIWTSQVDVGYIQQYIDPADRFPAAIGDLTTPWSVETAHHPSLAYIPYLATGDLYYLEELHFWATFILGASNGSYRGGAQCWLIDQIRGNAWDLRSVVDAAAMTPDAMPERAYLNEKIANNITRWNGMFINSEGPTIRSYGAGSYTGEPSIDPANCSYASGIWQDDYLTWSFIHAWQMGYPTLELAHWGGKGVIDRFTGWPGWNRYRAAPYAMPVMGKDAGGNAIQYATWADVNNGFTDKVGPSSFGSAVGNPNSYEYAARGVLALISNLSNGEAAFSWAASQLPASTYSGDTRWAFVPIPYIPGDVDNSGRVDVSDLLMLAWSWGLSYGTVGFDTACDFNADFDVDVADLLILAQHFGQ